MFRSSFCKFVLVFHLYKITKHFRSVKNRNEFLADRELFDRTRTESVVGNERMIHRVNFVLPTAGSQISKTLKIGGMSIERNFYLASLDAGI